MDTTTAFFFVHLTFSFRILTVGDAPAHRTICRQEPVFTGKVTCGVWNETSGRSWPSFVTQRSNWVDAPSASRRGVIC